MRPAISEYFGKRLWGNSAGGEDKGQPRYWLMGLGAIFAAGDVPGWV